jgi:hypothetical protein
MKFRASGVVVSIDDDNAHLAEFAWYVDSYGYVARSGPRVNGRQAKVYLAREVLGLVSGDGTEADHINRDRLDNRRENLRVVTQGQNKQNRGAQRTYCGEPPTSAHRGVTWDARRGRWRAKVNVEGKTHHVGYFTDEGEAAAAASAFRRDRMPFSTEVVA